MEDESSCWMVSTSYLTALGGDQQRPGQVGVIQAVQLAGRLHSLHVETVASKDIDGIRLLVVDCRVAVQT